MITELPILKENYIVAFQTGAGLLPYKVVKKEIIPFVYDIMEENGNLPPLSPVTQTITGFSPFFLEFNTLQLTSIQNVQDMFSLTRTNSTQSEVLQVFTGIQPSYVRFIYKQPTTEKLMNMDQNINLSQSFYQQGYDGFISPFNDPSPDTEIFVVPGLSFSMILVNTVSVPVNPVINFIINRMQVTPIIDSKTISDIQSGRIPAKIVSLGGVFSSVNSYINSSFGGGK